MLQPSRPGYNFSAADLVRANITPEELGRMIALRQQSPENYSYDAMQLLAALLKSQKPANALYKPSAFSFATYRKQMLFAENPNRNYLIIQNVGGGDLMVVFESGETNVADYSAAADQAQLTGLQTRALRIVAGGYFEPLTPPKNPITIFTLNTATNGVAIEGG